MFCSLITLFINKLPLLKKKKRIPFTERKKNTYICCKKKKVTKVKKKKRKKEEEIIFSLNSIIYQPKFLLDKGTNNKNKVMITDKT